MRLTLFSAFAALILAALANPANAAPQILGLVATANPVPLTCIDGKCSAEFSAVCLQEHRKAPQSGTAYKAVKGSDLKLVVQNSQGVRRSFPVADKVEITSLRIFSAVSISLPKSVIQAMGGKVMQASLSVGPLASALPVAVAGDKNPLGVKEIAESTGVLRNLAESAIGRDTTNLTATRILNRMINHLPPDRPSDAEEIASLLDQTMTPEAAAKVPAAARLVDRALETCRELIRVERTPHLRACIGIEHDNLNVTKTQNVWKSLRPGG